MDPITVAVLDSENNQLPLKLEMEESSGCVHEKEVEPSLKAKVKFEKAEKLIQKLNQMKFQILLDLEKRKADRDYFKTLLQTQPYWGRVFGPVYKKKEQLKYLKESLDVLQESTAEGNYRMIQKLCHQLQYGKKNFAEERRILREINHAEEERVKISSDADKKRRQQSHWALGEIPDTKGGIKDQINIMLSELQDLKKKQMPFILYENKLRKDKAAAEKDICFLKR
ncbi:uncharacterized protein LOC111372138 [Olea europaea var. sylvestris]|uniref:uncharacterized protein LOC111372138 n=1 Tax=Olea europaea var. sylvestris TaxID=158386 RepID=UPI000C1D19BD|nr:uncharacterized protein LOC111372138 [Olea europaea var. sylvestris]